MTRGKFQRFVVITRALQLYRKPKKVKPPSHPLGLSTIETFNLVDWYTASPWLGKQLRYCGDILWNFIKAIAVDKKDKEDKGRDTRTNIFFFLPLSFCHLSPVICSSWLTECRFALGI
jgi:hypothetical protein